MKNKLNSATLKRTLKEKVEEVIPASISAGPVDKVIELAFNPSRDKIREVTVVDRMQGRLFPQIDMVNMLLHYCLEISFYRQDKEEYKRKFNRTRPVPPDAMDEFLFRTAQWQKSVAGRNLDRAIDIALAETEAKAEMETPYDADKWEK